MNGQVSCLEKIVLALKLNGDQTAEAELLEQFYEVLQDHSRPSVVSIVKAAEAKALSLARYSGPLGRPIINDISCRLIQHVLMLLPILRLRLLLLRSHRSWTVCALQ